MNTVFHPDALDHLAYWVAEDPKIAAKVLLLIQDARRHPFTGLGKPEPLRENFKGWWSRRITDERPAGLSRHGCRRRTDDRDRSVPVSL